MQKANDLKLKRQRQDALASMRLAEMSTPKVTKTYNVVHKVTGDTVAKDVPLEHVLSYNNPTQYRMEMVK